MIRGPSIVASSRIRPPRRGHAVGTHGSLEVGGRDMAPHAARLRRPRSESGAGSASLRRGYWSLRYSASQTVSSVWFRKWLGMICQPRTFARWGTIRFHWNPMMKCTSSS